MRAPSLLPAVAVGLAMLRCSALAGQAPPTKKLIEFGWDRPSPSFLAAHSARMDSSLFDGVVLQFSTGSTVLRLRGVDTTALNRDAALLQGLVFQRLTNNFALMNLTPDSAWDWLDARAWRVSESNIWRLARATKAAGLKGIALDYEPYGRNPWDYRKLRHGPGRSFDDYAAAARHHGRRLMEALQGGFPDPVILTFFQMSYLDRIAALGNPASRQGALAQTDYGLLVPFVMGMLEAAKGTTSITDGNERGYWYGSAAEFEAGTKAVREDALRLFPDSLKASYQARVRVGQPIFLDYLLGIYLHPGDSVQVRLPESNRMRRLEWATYQAFRNADEYVWLYAQKVNWWNGDTLPTGLVTAIASARTASLAGVPLGFDLKDLMPGDSLQAPPKR